MKRRVKFVRYRQPNGVVLVTLVDVKTGIRPAFTPIMLDNEAGRKSLVRYAKSLGWKIVSED